MKTLRTMALATAVSAGLLGSVGAMAANQGSLGGTSNGDFDITIVNSSGVRIWGLQDFTFDTDGTSSLQQSDINICIFTNDSTSTTDGQYDIIATGSDLVLSNGGGSDTLNYTVEYSDSKDATNAYQTLISAGTIATEVDELNAGNLFSQPDPTLGDVCNAADTNANVRVTIDPTGATSGTYTGTVYLAISPN